MSVHRLDDEQLQELTQVLRETRPVELTCEEWLDRVGSYAESAATGQPASLGAELIEQHLAICPECREELEALLLLLRQREPT